MSGSPASFVEAVSRAVIAMPPGHVASLAEAIGTAPGFSNALVSRGLEASASPAYRKNAQQFLDAWATVPDVSGQAAALALLSAGRARIDAVQEETVEVVWTGPTSHEIPVRRTREALLELIGLASKRLIVVSFAAYRVPEVLAAVAGAAARGVNVRLILESSEDSRGRLSRDAAEAFASLACAAEFYVWPFDRRIAPNGATATLHAKAVVADTEFAFVTSANLTGSALSTNMELGLFVRGGSIPGRLVSHFDELIAQGVLKRVS